MLLQHSPSAERQRGRDGCPVPDPMSAVATVPAAFAQRVDRRWETTGPNERHAERIPEQDARVPIGTRYRQPPIWARE
jgi:hypothetical protein